MRTFTAYVQFDEEAGVYVGIVPGVTGGHTQGATLDELNRNLKEVIELCLEETPDLVTPRFVGVQQIEISP